MNSCSTGKGEDSFAQEIANELGNDVIAPTDTLTSTQIENPFTGNPHHLGDSVRNGGTWKTFTPQN